mgnify:CR=1 FL=1
METPLNTSCDITIEFDQEPIDLSEVEFTGTFCSEPPEPANGYPGFMDVDIEVIDIDDVYRQVEDHFSDNGVEREIDITELQNTVQSFISDLVLEDPEKYIQ